MNEQWRNFGTPMSLGVKLMILLVFLLAGTPGVLSAQYEGAESCTGCHDAQYQSWITSGHRFILMNGIQARHRPLPLPEGRSWNDISYVVGGNKTRAAYLDDQGYLIQDQFNLKTGEWSDLHSGGMVPYDCGACHTTGYEESGNQDGLAGFMGTFQLPGVQCEHCHGPGANFTTGMQAGSTDPAFCGSCHNHGPEGMVAASDGFILSEGQYNEFMASPHDTAEDVNGCVGCHDPHKSAQSITAECSSCHTEEASAYAGTLMDTVGVECIDCHMPPATLSGSPLGPHEGDMKSHIFRINTDPAASMFTPDGSELALDGGEGAVTLDFVCQRCHSGTSLDTLAKFAHDFHEQDGSLENIGLNPGLSGTWWGGPDRSGEGFLVEFAYAGPTLYFFGSMYTYDSAGNRVWLTFQPAAGAVPESGTAIDVLVYITEGGTWGDGFDAGNVVNDQFGIGTFTFDTCTTGSVSITPAQAYLDLGYSAMGYDLSRLLGAGVDCPTFNNTSEVSVANQ